jgi:hypothetical protein
MSAEIEIEIEVSPSTKGIGCLPWNIYEDDSTFIVAKSSYHYPSFLASFLLPWIYSGQMIDPTFQKFFPETNDPDHDVESILGMYWDSSFRIGWHVSVFWGFVVSYRPANSLHKRAAALKN